jgi:transcriptional regulator with XRE-family HTH domain
MTIDCKLRVLLARANVERAKQGKPALSLRRLAYESGVSLSVIAALHTGKNQRIDYTTIDQLLNYFDQYFRVTIDDLLSWANTGASDVQMAPLASKQTVEISSR